jgi:hypothetical protein
MIKINTHRVVFLILLRIVKTKNTTLGGVSVL